mgnify:CR=1 FL=1
MKKLLKAIYLYTLLFTLILNLNTISYTVLNEIDYTISDKLTYEILPFSDNPNNKNNPH